MTRRTFRLSQLPGRTGHACTLQVLALCYWLKMIWIDARRIPAEMVKDSAFGDLSAMQNIGGSMR
jgi:hypothetical protein